MRSIVGTLATSTSSPTVDVEFLERSTVREGSFSRSVFEVGAVIYFSYTFGVCSVFPKYAAGTWKPGSSSGYLSTLFRVM
jgi:hypothetical protein